MVKQKPGNTRQKSVRIPRCKHVIFEGRVKVKKSLFAVILSFLTFEVIGSENNYLLESGHFLGGIYSDNLNDFNVRFGYAYHLEKSQQRIVLDSAIIYKVEIGGRA